MVRYDKRSAVLLVLRALTSLEAATSPQDRRAWRVRRFRTRSLLLLLQRDASLFNDIHPGSWVIHSEAIPSPGLWLRNEGFTGIALGRHRAAHALSQ